MDSRLDNQIEPVCKFGPGGDFVSVWPGEPQQSRQPSTNRLTKLLTSLSEMISTLLGSELNTASKENLEYAVESKADKSAYSPSTTVIKSDSLISGEPILFADDRRISVRAGHKPKHRIRAYRRAAKKRSALSFGGQGSLFETNFKSARIA